MLETLHIINYALIDDLTIEFDPGLNIFTGSTGAGKTIIFGALGLSMGEKASEEIIRNGANTATVEAEFSYNKTTDMLFDNINDSENIIIRREIKRDGRSRAYANNRQITLQFLKTIGAKLTDIVGQHKQKGLTDPSEHRQILDLYAGLDTDLQQLAELYNKYYKLKSGCDDLKSRQDKSTAEKELLEFQVKEIEFACLSEDEDNHLQKEKQQLINAEKVKASCRLCYDSLFDEDGSAAERFKSAEKEIGYIGKFSNQAEIIKSKMDELSINLDEVGVLLRDLSDSFEFDQSRLEIVDDRIALINKLKHKYGRTISEILKFCEEAKIRAAGFENLNEEYKRASRELINCRNELSKKARDVSQRRHDAAIALEKEVVKHLSDLSMKGSDFKIGFESKESADGPFLVDQKSLAGNEHGFDDVEFLICPNPGEQLKPLATTASGGELSRILLAICSALADIFPKGTLVFDEIDTGISGEVASQVGKKLQKLAVNRQVICITHLQQIASRGEAHFKVYKGKSKGRSVTRIKKLDGDQRVAEIARLLAGEKISDIALDGAVKLLKEGRS